jgi:predicted metal-dependent phosphoesterase TrpH
VFENKKVDLHMHSYYSDGEFSPERLVEIAKENGVGLLSLTDHDEIRGLDRMEKAAREAGISYVNGVEITAIWGPKNIHIVGLNFDRESADLNAYLSHVRIQRRVRAEKIAGHLDKLGMPDAWEGVIGLVKNPDLISRNHFASWLLKMGYVKTRQEAFDRWLSSGRPAFEAGGYGSVTLAVQVILEAGGTPVLAHPGRYNLDPWALQELLDLFKKEGGVAIEVTTGSHRPEHVPLFARIAREQGFEVSTGSDFHFLNARCPIGEQGELPPGLVPVWHRFAI